MSIFEEYYTKQPFHDRFISDNENAIDVIVPVYHTNELWQANLTSIYREVPVNRLLISDGGCIDDSIEIVSKFPRVSVLDHREYKTLGKCIAELIKMVDTKWFIYLHSDVYLPAGWFDTMIKYNNKYDWYGCPMNITVLINYRLEEPLRPYAGSQIGRKEAFEKGISVVEDDYVYRQEDFVFNRIVEDAGFKTGKVEDTFHYHQLMYRKSAGYDLNVKKVSVETITKEWERQRTDEMQLRGIVKYLIPHEPYVINDFKAHAFKMLLNRQIQYADFRKWIKEKNSTWLKYFDYKLLLRIQVARLKKRLRKIAGR